MANESILTMSSAGIKYGFGATREIGWDLKELGAHRVLVVTDPRVAGLSAVATVLESLKSEGLEAEVYGQARVEPTDASLLEAVEVAR
ncbi:MAG: iron-containing alcohol dehydrogenase, partial [Spirochaetales bacterium]|nr:iron-containing alcohol dehydrogenase [Spirochaetales bacterium]